MDDAFDRQADDELQANLLILLRVVETRFMAGHGSALPGAIEGMRLLCGLESVSSMVSLERELQGYEDAKSEATS